MSKSIRFLVVLMLGLLVVGGEVIGQPSHVEIRPLAPNIIMPQVRRISFSPDQRQGVNVIGVEALIDIVESTSTTTIEVTIENTTNRRQEAELIFPVPDGAVIRGFAYDGPGGEITAKVLPKEEARRIYQQLVARIKDPAFVEFIGFNLIQSSVFPIEANSKQKVRLTFEHLLDVDGNRIDYVLPRTESLQYAVPWKVTANIRAKRPISTVYSASHKMTMERRGAEYIKVEITEKATREPGPIYLSYLLQEDAVTASLFTYPDKSVGGGYFLLIAGTPAVVPEGSNEPFIKRELTIVIDCSGSMRGEKIEQAKEAALQIIGGLKYGEAFNIITYNNNVEWFAREPVIKSRETEAKATAYIDGITVTGGTNIHEALLTALKQKPSFDMLPIVLFLTDGLPTVGNTSEVAIRDLVTKENPYKRRVFTFGVGDDVNASLLEKIADDSRARVEFVLPGEDIEVKVGRVFKSLTGPVLADVELRLKEMNGSEAIGRVRELLPAKMPDLFEGDQLVLLGKYIGDDPLRFEISGNYHGRQRNFKFEFDFDKATVRNGFVPRLWASRKIAELIDEVQQMGAEREVSHNDPKVKELVDEIVRLSTEFGILTEYTAFLAREGTELADRMGNSTNLSVRLEERARNSWSGGGRGGMGGGFGGAGREGVVQSLNSVAQKRQTELNRFNKYLDSNMNEVLITDIQQINDRTYYRRDNQWIDSKIAQQESEVRPDRIVIFGSDEFVELAEKLAQSNRAGSIALGGDVLLEVDGEKILVKMQP